MRTRWTEQAVEDLAGIKAYIARDSLSCTKAPMTRLWSSRSFMPRERFRKTLA